MAKVDDWFLTPAERGNAATRIDRRAGENRAWTERNLVTPLVHGATYFERLHSAISSLDRGDRVWFFDWRGDADERLAGPGTELGQTLVSAIRRGVDVRGLVWRSHPDQEQFSEQESMHLAE